MTPIGAESKPALWDDWKRGMFRTEFEERYPRDREEGQELGDRARVWKVYRGEAVERDDSQLKIWNDTVNILLTFAGLFSATVTSFVIASTSDLKPDPNAYVANVLVTLFNSSTGNPSAFAGFQAPPPLHATPPLISRVVNALWFASLFLSLSAALLCILVKQWLDQYLANTRASAKHPRHWAQRRAFYAEGLKDWSVAAIISFLPVLLHLALFLFFAGLTAYLWALDRTIAHALVILTGALLALYLGSLVIPLWSAACPYATPLLTQVVNLFWTGAIAVRSIESRVFGVIEISCISRHEFSTSDEEHGGARDLRDTVDERVQTLRERRARQPFDRILERARAGRSASELEGHLDCAVLSWLIHDVSDSEAVAVGLQSLGALLRDPHLPRAQCLISKLPAIVVAAGVPYPLWTDMRLEGPLDEPQLYRIVRSLLWLNAFGALNTSDAWRTIPPSDRLALDAATFPDTALAVAHMRDDLSALTSHASEWQSASSTVAATAMAVLRLRGRRHWTQARDSPDWTIGLLICSEPGEIARGDWKLIGRNLDFRGEDGRGTHFVQGYVAEAIALRASRIQTDGDVHRVIGTSTPEITAFDPWCHAYVVVRILASMCHDLRVSVRRSRRGAADSRQFYFHRDSSSEVWTTLTNDRYWERITSAEALPWAQALSVLLYHSSPTFYAAATIPYLATWRGLVSAALRKHRALVLPNLDVDISCFSVGNSGDTLNCLLEFWDVTLKATYESCAVAESPDSQRRILHSLLSLFDAVTTTLCSLDVGAQLMQVHSFERLEIVQVSDLLLAGLDLFDAEDYRAHWTLLGVRTIRHYVQWERRAWRHLVDIIGRISHEGKSVYLTSILEAVREQGPCKEGDCVGNVPENWPPGFD